MFFDNLDIMTFDYGMMQPIQAFQHPKFNSMIDMALRATNGVLVPGRKATRGEIMRMFRVHFVKLKALFKVST
jgi:hypothetical protein